MAGSRNKNSRSVSAPKGAFQVPGDMALLQPLNFGKHVRLMDPSNGKSLHLSTSDEAWITKMAALKEAGYANRLLGELQGFASRFPDHEWGNVIRRLQEADAV